MEEIIVPLQQETLPVGYVLESDTATSQPKKVPVVMYKGHHYKVKSKEFRSGVLCGNLEPICLTGKIVYYTSDEDDARMLPIGQNGNTGEHYDKVIDPKHYDLLGDVTAIDVIACSLTREQFFGYCLGNMLKYKLRAGGKDDVQQELAKANNHKALFDKYKHMCKT